jgi:Helix-turn-helix domain
VSQTQSSKSAAKQWPKRRQWLDRIAVDPRLTRGAKAQLMVLAARSDNAGKPVWGCQARLAADSDTSVRTVRRYTAEAEALGYLRVFRSRPQRGPDGRWCRRKSNSYYLSLPPASGALEAPRRVKPAGRCVVASHKRRSHLADSAGRSSPYGERQPASSPPEMAISEVVTLEKADMEVASGDKEALFAALRGRLGPRRRS